MAGFGHFAVGLVSGRRHKEVTGSRSTRALFLFPLLGLLPDIDVAWVNLGVPDVGWAGHRGFTHTPLFAVACGLVAAAWRVRQDRPWKALTLAVTLTVLSHGILDALAQDGRGIMFLWPISELRMHFPWRPIPDAPRGVAILSPGGLAGQLLEFAYFAPFWLYAVWPRRRTPAAQTSVEGPLATST
jgi:inner membrane protein